MRSHHVRVHYYNNEFTKEYYVPTLHLYVRFTPALYNCTALLKYYSARSKYVADRNNDNIDANGTCHRRIVIIYACNTTLYRLV